MKNCNILLIFILSTCMILGCSNNKNIESSSSFKESISKNIKVNEINFDVIINENLPQNIQNTIKTMKANRGYIIDEYEGDSYISIFTGKKNNEGFSIKVLSVEDNMGEINMVVQEVSPTEGSVIAEEISYPNLTLKVIGVLQKIVIKNIKGDTFPRVLQEGEIY